MMARGAALSLKDNEVRPARVLMSCSIATGAVSKLYSNAGAYVQYRYVQTS